MRTLIAFGGMSGEQPSYKRGLVHYGRVVFLYNPKYCDSQKANETMFAAITTFMVRMPLYIVVMDKTNVYAQFKSSELLGADWDKGTDIPDPEVLVGIFRVPDEQSALEAVEYGIGYPQEVLKVRRIAP